MKHYILIEVDEPTEGLDHAKLVFDAVRREYLHVRTADVTDLLQSGRWITSVSRNEIVKRLEDYTCFHCGALMSEHSAGDLFGGPTHPRCRRPQKEVVS
jgi:hypothetical protein